MSREQETLWRIIIVEFMFLFSVIFAGTQFLHCFRLVLDTSYEKHVSTLRIFLYIGTK